MIKFLTVLFMRARLFVISVNRAPFLNQTLLVPPSLIQKRRLGVRLIEQTHQLLNVQSVTQHITFQELLALNVPKLPLPVALHTAQLLISVQLATQVKYSHLMVFFVLTCQVNAKQFNHLQALPLKTHLSALIVMMVITKILMVRV